MAISVKIRGGTAPEGAPSLCLTCRFAKIARGSRANDQIVYCSQLQREVAFRISSCTEFVDHGHPSLWQMEDIAWVLRTDSRRRVIGFVRSRDLKERLAQDDD